MAARCSRAHRTNAKHIRTAQALVTMHYSCSFPLFISYQFCIEGVNNMYEAILWAEFGLQRFLDHISSKSNLSTQLLDISCAIAPLI
eukprot:scaffold95079_cov15-Prasinocladus_malaysianus.AAC.1